MVKSPRLLLISTCLLLASICGAQAAEIKIASPSAYLDREGEGVFGGDSADQYRYQQVFPAADFAALGNQPHWIVGFGPRADQSVTSPHTAYLPDNYVRLSTTQKVPGNQSTVFDNNFGSDVMPFYSGPLTMVADVAGPGPGPKEFYHADFPAGVTPFLYDPSQGNLLFDFIAWQGESPKILADQIPSMRTIAGDSSATEGFSGVAAIFQFTFVPVVAGDTNADGAVDVEDLNAVRNHFGEKGDRVPGDTSPFDGQVDVSDLNAVRNNFGASPNPVPEPSSLALLLVALVGTALRKAPRG